MASDKDTASCLSHGLHCSGYRYKYCNRRVGYAGPKGRSLSEVIERNINSKRVCSHPILRTVFRTVMKLAARYAVRFMHPSHDLAL
jgi:hypothetical protein